MRRGRRVRMAPNTPQWLAWRASGITAGDTAAILGLSPWTSAYDLWHQKRADRAAVAEGQTLQEIERSQRFELGHAAEPLLARFWLDEQAEDDVRLMSGGCWQGIGSDAWLRATPDRVAVKRGTRTPLRLVEFKTTAQDWGDDTGDGVPPIPVYYRAQVLHQMLLAGVQHATLTALTGRMAVRHYLIEAQPGELETVYDAAHVFELSVRNGIAPDIDGSTATAARVRSLWADQVEDVDAIVPAELVQAWTDAKQAAEAAETEHRRLTSLLLDAMGPAKRAVLPDGTKAATRSVSYRTSVDRKALAADHPDLLEQYSRQATEPTVQLRAAARPTKGHTL